MSDVISMNDMLGVASGDKSNMLGKLLYFSLSDLLIDKEKLAELCAGMGFYYAGDRRVSVSDAFKSATGDIKDRIVVKNFGQQQIYRVYCRDNEHTARVLSRELVKETLNRETNQYEKLANISFDKRHYEQVLRRELDGLDEEFESLKLLSQELSLRASGIRFQRAA